MRPAAMDRSTDRSSGAVRHRLGVLLFDRFETLDVFGPLQMFGGVPDRIEIVLVSHTGAAITSTQGQKLLADVSMNDCAPLDILLVPGGIGTRQEVDNHDLISWIRERASRAMMVTSVCTGAALLARAGVLDGRRATTNKRAFAWVASQGPEVEWIAEARWVEDGKFLTAAGVSAGMDMALTAIARLADESTSEELATRAEYDWHRDASWDPFAAMNGLV